MMMLMPGQHLQWVVILNMCRRNYISHPPSSWQFYIHRRWVEAAMKRFKRHQNGIFSPRMAVPVPKSPPKTIIAKYPHIFSGSYDCGDIVGRWWGLQVGYCAAVDNFGAMAPEIGLLARLNIQLLFCDRTFWHKLCPERRLLIFTNSQLTYWQCFGWQFPGQGRMLWTVPGRIFKHRKSM